MKFLLIILFAIVGCQPPPVVMSFDSDKRLVSLFREFSREAIDRGIVIDQGRAMAFVVKDLPHPIVGYCNGVGPVAYYGHGVTGLDVVAIDADFMDKFDEKSFLIKALVFHEFGHCFLDYMHDEESFNLMSTSLGDGTVTYEYLEEYYQATWTAQLDYFFIGKRMGFKPPTRQEYLDASK